MTLESFIAACRAKKSRRTTTNCWGHDIAKEVFPRRCDWCSGKSECWPDELVLVDVVTTKGEDKNNMTTVAGCVCDVCGKPANNKKNKSRGMTLCSSCKGIVPCVDRLDAVVAMMQRTGKTEELLNKLRPHDDLKAVVRDAKETLVNALPPAQGGDTQSLYDIATIAEEVARYIQEQQEKIARLNTDDKAYQLEMENNRLRRENEYLAQRKRQEPLDCALLEWARKRYEAGEIKLKVTVEAADENN